MLRDGEIRRLGQTIGGYGVGCNDIEADSSLSLYAAREHEGEQETLVDDAVGVIDAALEDDRTLGGTVDWAECSPPEPPDDDPLTGAATLAAARVVITLALTSTRSIG